MKTQIVFPLYGGKTWTAEIEDGAAVAFDLSNVTIRAIAHGLANVNRFCGATDRAYSVAEHSVHLVNWLADADISSSLLKLALLHDASEALGCADAHGALKKAIAPGVRVFEADLMVDLWYRLTPYGWCSTRAETVKEYDHLLGNWEARCFGYPNVWDARREDTPPWPQCWSASDAESRFMEMWESL